MPAGFGGLFRGEGNGMPPGFAFQNEGDEEDAHDVEDKAHGHEAEAERGAFKENL